MNRRSFVSSASLVGLVLLLTTPKVFAEASITIDAASTLRAAGDPIASGFRTAWTTGTGHMSGRSTPFNMVEPLKPSSVGAPPLWPEADSLWTWAARTGATVVAVLDGPWPLDPDPTDPWQAGPYFAEPGADLARWGLHCKRMWAFFDSARVTILNGDTVAVPVQYDVWNEPDLSWHPYGMEPGSDESRGLFFEVWRTAVDTLRASDATVVITGPTFAHAVDGADPMDPEYSGIRMDSLLVYCRAHSCMPNVIGWHHIGSSDYRAPDDRQRGDLNLYGQVAYARSCPVSCGKWLM